MKALNSISAELLKYNNPSSLTNTSGSAELLDE
jgi:hypothetical protein